MQKRKVARAQREIELEKERQTANLENAFNDEISRLNEGDSNEAMATAEKRMIHVIGDLVLDAKKETKKKQLSRKQMKRKSKLVERGEAITDTLERKFDQKKRRVKIRAQVRNSNLHS